jgi:energy-coupling factor transport system substrate-specific component
MLAALMFAGRVAMQHLPNIHILGLIIAVTTLVFRRKALIPLYLYVLLEGLFSGFALWWVPYLYIWLPLWGVFMLLGRAKLPKRAKPFIFAAANALHGLAFGTLYAPLQAIMFGLSFHGMLAWIAAGFWFDILHAVGNAVGGMLIVPLEAAIRRLGTHGKTAPPSQ